MVSDSLVVADDDFGESGGVYADPAEPRGGHFVFFAKGGLADVELGRIDLDAAPGM